MLNILASATFPVDEIVALASRSPMGSEVSLGDKTNSKTKDLDTFRLYGLWDMAAVFACRVRGDKEIRAQGLPKAGCVVIE